MQESRKIILEQSKRHQLLLELQTNPKKKAKVSRNYVDEMQNKLFHFGHNQRPPVLYQRKAFI